MADISIIETGAGGDMRLLGNDLLLVDGYENMLYLAMFGGSDWWGNSLITGDASTQFKSQTEAVLNQVVLNSAGRIKVEAAIKADLAFIEAKITGSKLTVSTTIAADNRLDININISGKNFYYQWNPDGGYLTYKV